MQTQGTSQQTGGVPRGPQPPRPGVAALPQPVVYRPGLLSRWPTPPRAHPGLMLAFLLLGLLAAATLLGRAGVQYPLIGLGVVAVVVLAQRLSPANDTVVKLTRQQRLWRVAFAVLSLALVCVAALRDGLTSLAVFAALGIACYAVVPDNRLSGALLAPALTGLGALRGFGWLSRAPQKLGRAFRLDPAVVRGASVAGLLLVVVGALLANADSAFSGLLHSLVPSLEVDRPGQRLFLALVVIALAVGLSYSALAPADLGPRHLSDGKARIEWLLPVAGLGLVLGVFLLVQAAVLFDRYPQALVEGYLTPAERARTGFGHLVTVTLIVIATLAWSAARVRHRDRTWFALAGGLVLVEVLFLAASALRRLLLYSDAFGWSVARVEAGAFEAWLAITVVVTAVLWFIGRGQLTVKVSVFSAGLGVLLLAVVSPDALVARASVERYAATGKIDGSYLTTLSADAAPALMKLPEPARTCIFVNPLQNPQHWQSEHWYEYNVSRAQAQRLLWENSVTGIPDCAGVTEYG